MRSDLPSYSMRAVMELIDDNGVLDCPVLCELCWKFAVAVVVK